MTISPTTAERRISAGSSVSAAGQRPPLTPQTSHHYIKEYPIRSQKLQQPILSTNDFNSNSGSHHGSSSLNNSDNRYYNHNKWNVKSSNETLATQTNAETKSKWTIDQAEIASLTSSTKQFPWDAFLLAIILLITGFCLFVVGIIQWFSVKTPEQQAEWQKLWVVYFVLGPILFAPGFYYVRIAWLAYKGRPGYEFSQLLQ